MVRLALAPVLESAPSLPSNPALVATAFRTTAHLVAIALPAVPLVCTDLMVVMVVVVMMARVGMVVFHPPLSADHIH